MRDLQQAQNKCSQVLGCDLSEITSLKMSARAAESMSLNVTERFLYHGLC